MLRRPPRPTGAPMLGKAEWRSVIVAGALQTVVVLSVYIWALEARGLVEARNLAFTTLVFGELLRAFAARSPDRLFWEVGAWTNVRLLTVVVTTVALQIAIHHTPFAQRLFQISDISLWDCGLSLLLGLVPVTVIELGKLVRRARRRTPGHRTPQH